MSIEDCGAYAVLFGDGKELGLKVPPCLVLLNLYIEDAARVVLQRIKALVTSKAVSEGETLFLIDDPDWRPHLVGMSAVYLGMRSNELVEHLWAAFDRGSWVSPQLAAVLSLVDNDFDSKAMVRLEKYCQISDTPKITNMIQRHVSRGPAGSYLRSCKAVSSLTALLEKHNDATPSLHTVLLEEHFRKQRRGLWCIRWPFQKRTAGYLHKRRIERMVTDGRLEWKQASTVDKLRIARMMCDDTDHGGHIATRWKSDFLEIVKLLE